MSVDIKLAKQSSKTIVIVSKESELEISRHGLGEMPDGVLENFRKDADRLFDPYNYDHSSLEEMVSSFQARDLAKSKIYRLAQKIFGDKMEAAAKRRKRLIFIEGMAPIKNNTILPGIQPGVPQVTEAGDGTTIGKPEYAVCKDVENQSEEDVYRHWVSERMKLRKGLNNLGLTESWLKNKAERSVMEEEIFQEFKARGKKQRTDDVESFASEEIESLSPELTVPDVAPLIRRPTPLALRKLDAYLKIHRVRLLDVFRDIDKAKTWNVSEDEFLKTIKERKMDITQSLLEDLLSTLDANNDGRLYYKDLSKGLDILRIENREMKRKGISYESGGDDQLDHSDLASGEPIRELSTSHTSKVRSVLSPIPSEPEEQSLPPRPESGGRPGSSPFLGVPPLDRRAEEYVLSSTEAQVDIRKRDKGALSFMGNKRHTPTRSPGEKVTEYTSTANHTMEGSMNRTAGQARSRRPTGGRGKSAAKQSTSHVAVFKTGYKPVDDHCSPSTLGGDTAEMVDNFRQLKLQEYYKVMRLCDQKGITLSRELLDRVLLHPGDKSHRRLLREGVRQAGLHLPHSSHFADPPKRPRTPIEIRNKHKMRRDENGDLLIDYRHLYPEREYLAVNRPTMEPANLSTGKCIVGRKVDCWMTFEEYERLTREYEVRYVKLHGKVDENVFWPGRLLDKLALHMPRDDSERGRQVRQGNAVFGRVAATERPRRNHGYDNDLNNWKVNDAGYLLQGSLRHPKTF